MIINEEVKAVIKSSAFISIITMNPDNTPHPIIVGSGEVVGETIVFGIYKMETTQKNLTTNPNAWVMGASKDGKPKGYRLTGTAQSNGKQLIFTAEKAEAMI